MRTCRHVARGLAAAWGLAIAALATTASAQEVTPHAGMIRYPDVSATEIVFSYANDLWVVDRAGGLARPLASPPGQELFPRFDPAGERIVFQGNYEGDRDLYTISVQGGVPTRITHHPASETPTDWHAERGIVFHMGGLAGLGRQQQVFTVAPEGGLPTRVPVPYGANGAISPDGRWLAYQPHQRDFRTWKRYRGGMATDIWLFDLETSESRRVTDWEGTDTLGMWHGKTLYYLSDAGDEHRLNIWAYDTSTGERRQVTRFSDYDVKFPSIGPGPDGQGEIVLQNGPGIYLIEPSTGQATRVEIRIPGARPKIRTRTVDAGRFIMGGAVSSTGKRAVLEARGDIWTLPADRGPVRQLTTTSGAAERSPAWSPDGRWIAYFSDADGEYELYVTQSDGKGETRQLTDGHRTYWFNVAWTPNSENLIITDKAGRMLLVDVQSGKTKTIDRDPWATQPWLDVSPDSRWIVYDKLNADGLLKSIWLYSIEDGSTHRLTRGFFNDHHPAFDRKGEYIFYASNREFSAPKYEDVGLSFVYDDTGKLIAVPLNADVEYPWSIEPDEETWDDQGPEDAPEDERVEGSDEQDGDADSPEGDAQGDEAQQDAATSPIAGTWSGTLAGLSAIGSPEDEVAFTMTIRVAGDGAISGSSEVMGQSSEFDSVSFDEQSGEFRATGSANGIESTMVGTLTGDSISGTWEIPAMGVSGTWSATRTGGPESEDQAEPASSDAGDEEPVEIRIEGFEARGFEIPVPRGNFANLRSNDRGHLLYIRAGGSGSPPAIKLVDVRDDDPSEKTVIAGVGGFDISGDGKKLLVAQGQRRFGIVSASAGQSIADPLRTDDMRKNVDPRAEWEQLFTDAWRRQRDFFYVENMHGVDWEAVRKRYAAMLDDAASREDVGFIIGEMISELNVGHAYYFGGDNEGQPSTGVGMLGVDFELASQTDQDGQTHTAYRIARILRGGPWDTDARGPLNVPGLGVEDGDFLLAVNGREIDTTKDPWAAFVGLAGEDTTLTIADSLVGDEQTRNRSEITIRPLGSEASLRFRDWIERNRAYVEAQSDGKIGYIYVPDTGINGQNELFRQFYGQIGAQALLIDERWNGGGQIPTRFIELLNRPRTNYWKRRDGKDWPWPPDSHQGPKAMLINGLAGSGGDMFPWLFKHNQLGKLIGTRTWGGLVGISSVPPLIDGGYTAVPNFGFYETDGTWGIEGHGVDPDIRVVDDPTKLAKGQRPQLDAAIQHLLNAIETQGYQPPEPPIPPDRSGMGIPMEDR